MKDSALGAEGRLSCSTHERKRKRRRKSEGEGTSSVFRKHKLEETKAKSKTERALSVGIIERKECDSLFGYVRV